MKQNVKTKSFLGTSKNAMLCQIWVAMIAYFNKLMAVLPVILFSSKDLWVWLNGILSSGSFKSGT